MTAANLTTGERMVKLEVKVENIEKLVTGIDGKLDSILKEQSDVRVNNVSRTELDSELKVLRVMFEASQKRNATQIFITGSLAALFGSILTLLLSYFIQTIGR